MPGSIVKTHNNPNNPLVIQVTQINFLSLLDYLNIVRFFSAFVQENTQATKLSSV